MLGTQVSPFSSCFVQELNWCQISTSQFMQAHTVLKSIVHEYTDKPVLVLGGRPGAVPRVAAEYVID